MSVSKKACFSRARSRILHQAHAMSRNAIRPLQTSKGDPATMDARTFWNQHYSKHSFQHGKAPSPFLCEQIKRLQKGKTLDMGMGEGNNAVFLAEQGFEVHGFDISEVAIDRCKALAEERGVQVQAQRADMDMYLFAVMEFDTIIMTHFKPALSRYYNEMIRALKQGGTLLIEGLSIHEPIDAPVQDHEFVNEHFKPNELIRSLNGLHVLYYLEGEVDGKECVRCVARKPVDKDAARFDLFDMHSKGEKKEDPNRQLERIEKLFKS